MRICSVEGCGKSLRRDNRSGYCTSCFLKSPEYKAGRSARSKARNARPEVKEQERLRHQRDKANPEKREAKRARSRARLAALPAGAEADRKLRERYGISLVEAEALLATQSGRCALCRAEIHRLGRRRGEGHVDHCHLTGRVRRVLCISCNHGVGGYERFLRLGLLEEVASYVGGPADPGIG